MTDSKYPLGMAVVPKIYISPERGLAFWTIMRCASSSTSNLMKRAGLTMVRDPSLVAQDWLHLALVREPYERYLSSLFITSNTSTDAQFYPDSWPDFFAFVEEQNRSGKFFTWNGDMHYGRQADFLVGMCEPMQLIPLEQSDRLDAFFPGRHRKLTRVNVTLERYKQAAREAISPEPVLEHYAADVELYLRATEADDAATAGLEPAASAEAGG